MSKNKKCPRCGNTLPIDMFYIQKNGSHMGKPTSYCKKCASAAVVEWTHTTGRQTPMNKNRKCPKFLGVHIAERVLSKYFEHITRMPDGNPGYDFVCGKGFKIDVKSACLHYSTTQLPKWGFHIRKNIIADYFLCLAFDNREDLTPMHIWLIPGNVVSKNVYIGIANEPDRIKYWSQYERSLDKVVECCSKIHIQNLSL